MGRPPRTAGHCAAIISRYARLWLEQALAPVGLGQQHLPLYGFLLYERPASQGELAAALGLDPSTVARALDQMERLGLVARRRRPADRRVNEVYLTAAGLALDGFIRARLDEWEAALLAGLEPAEGEQAVALLRRLATNAQRAVEGG